MLIYSLTSDTFVEADFFFFFIRCGKFKSHIQRRDFLYTDGKNMNFSSLGSNCGLYLLQNFKVS